MTAISTLVHKEVLDHSKPERRNSIEPLPKSTKIEPVSISHLIIAGLLLCSVFILIIAHSQWVLIGEILPTKIGW